MDDGWLDGLKIRVKMDSNNKGDNNERSKSVEIQEKNRGSNNGIEVYQRNDNK